MWNFITGRIQKNLLVIILFIAAIQGLLYVYLIPPWQHYDEPSHFEYAWLAANLPRWPKVGDYNLEMRREVAASMIEHGFYNGIGEPPNLLSKAPPDIGISQIRHMPLYYLLASLPLRIFKYIDITQQLYLVRFVSLFLFLFTILCAYKTCEELFSAGHPLRWMVPVFLSFLPPFVDLMTAANNDVAVTAFSTFFFWVCIRLLNKKAQIANILWLVLAAGLCYLSKNNGIIFIPLALFVIFLSIFERKRIIAWSILFILSAIFIVTAFSWKSSSPAYFYSTNDGFLPKVVHDPQAPAGKLVFVQNSQEHYWQSFYFFISPSDLRNLRGKTVTLGVWAWASEPLDVVSPALDVYKMKPQDLGVIHLENIPKYFAFPYQVPSDATIGWITVYTAQGEGMHIYWDDWTLVEGNFSVDSLQKYFDPDTQLYAGDNAQIRNLIRNGTGANTWPILRTSIGRFVFDKIGLTSSYLWSWLDLQNLGWYYRGSVAQLFRTFWGKFSWAQITLTGRRPFWVFIMLCLLSSTGIIIQVLKMSKSINWTLVPTLAVTWFVAIAMVSMRGVGSWLGNIYLPSARYMYPVILPTALILCIGWYGVGEIFKDKSRLWIGLGLLFLISLIVYDIWAIHSITSFYLAKI